MLNNSDVGQAVYEPFLGSGTTLIAAETIGRICYAIEVDPLYVDVAIRRWQAFTGKTAVLLDHGRTFEEISAVRGAQRGCEAAVGDKALTEAVASRNQPAKPARAKAGKAQRRKR
jgi:hypothetical protein